MIGEWKCRNGWKAEIKYQVLGWWIGFISVVGMDGHLYEVPSYWGKDLKAARPEWDLMERRRGAENF